MSFILEALLNASERAATVARACGDGTGQGALLVAEKFAGEANSRFEHDFKTLADVLAQESARSVISASCPTLAQYVRGEERSEIDGVRIEIMETVDETAKILCGLVPTVAAQRMAEAAHATPNPPLVGELPDDLPYIDPADLGVWIDPIDGTSEFISGVRGEAGDGCGLPCVTVLLGVYLRSTGEPVIGVINQPFFNQGKGRIIWGISYAGTNKWGGVTANVNNDSKTVLLSSAERREISEKLKTAGWHVDSVPGAGHKLLNVALGDAAAYVVSRGTTFRWDTCGPHAILKAQGGDIISFSTKQPLTYNDPMDADTQQFCNNEGIVAFSAKSVLDTLNDLID